MTSVGNLDYRNDLVIEYQNYARAVSFKIIHQFKIPQEYYDDVFAAANLGLLEAAGRFDPNFGVDFKVYAYFRIRGEAIDFIRKNTNLSISEYKQLKAFQELDEFAQTNYYQKNLIDQQDSNSQSQQLTNLLNHLTSGALIYRLQKATTPIESYLNNYSQEIANDNVSEIINSLLEVLNEREYKIIYDYYFLDKSFMEISQELNNFSKSWMSRMHHQALRKMRSAYLEKLHG